MDNKEKIDVIDFIIGVLRDHEKKFDGQLDRFEEFLDMVKPELGGLSYAQARNVVEAQAHTIRDCIRNPNALPRVESHMRVMIQDFVNALDRRKLIPNKWVDGLIRAGTERLSDQTGTKIQGG